MHENAHFYSITKLFKYEMCVISNGSLTVKVDSIFQIKRKVYHWAIPVSKLEIFLTAVFQDKLKSPGSYLTLVGGWDLTAHII